jgi:hypothetical protein
MTPGSLARPHTAAREGDIEMNSRLILLIFAPGEVLTPTPIA